MVGSSRWRMEHAMNLPVWASKQKSTQSRRIPCRVKWRCVMSNNNKGKTWAASVRAANKNGAMPSAACDALAESSARALGVLRLKAPKAHHNAWAMMEIYTDDSYLSRLRSVDYSVDIVVLAKAVETLAAMLATGKSCGEIKRWTRSQMAEMTSGGAEVVS
jgi:hypothetical protein